MSNTNPVLYSLQLAIRAISGSALSLLPEQREGQAALNPMLNKPASFLTIVATARILSKEVGITKSYYV